jgi:hypothetical protein
MYKEELQEAARGNILRVVTDLRMPAIASCAKAILCYATLPEIVRLKDYFRCSKPLMTLNYATDM